MHAVIIVSLIVGLSFLGGCKPTAHPSPKSQKSTMATLIEGATGKTAVDAGKRAEEKILLISEKHNAELSDVLGE